MSVSESRKTFFKQSGWMALASTLGGLFFMLAGSIAFHMPDGQVNVFDTALAALAIFGTPALGTQAAFAAMAAGADTPDRLKQVGAMMRGALAALAGLWLVFVGISIVARDWILASFDLYQPALLWTVVFNGLVVLWFPVAAGVLQGRQDFLWYGLGTLLNGAGRFVALVVTVVFLSMGALGSLLGIVAGGLAVLVGVMWRTRSILTMPGGRANWREFLQRAVPLTLGLGALVFIMQADALIFREKLQPILIQDPLTKDDIGVYTAARRIAQVLVYLIGAVVIVMFPKVARSFQRTESTEALKLTLGMTLVISVLGALATTLMPHVALKILTLGAQVETATSTKLVISFTWALVPLALCNVLAWNLLAREQYRGFPIALVVVAGAYWLALRRFSDSLMMVIGVVAVAALTLLVVCIVFTLLDRRRVTAGPVAES